MSTLKERDRRRRLADAGVEVIDPWPPDGGLVTPVGVAWSASSARSEDGRVDRPFDDSEPGRIGRANAAWLQAAEQHGLFDADGMFLVAVDTGSDDEPLSAWFMATILPTFDLFGRGAEQGVLGFGRGVPEFVMHSADGEMLLKATSYESLFSIIVIARPYSAAALRRAARLRRASAEPDELAALDQWLGRHRG